MRSAKKKPFSESRIFSKHGVENWRDYNNYLRLRGDLGFMLAQDLADGWYEDKALYRSRGRSITFSDTAIITCLKIKFILGLPYRQTQGFINYLFRQAGIKVTCPDYTTLSRRAKDLDIRYEEISPETEYVAVDSTGIQTYTGNEWLENKHGKKYQRRTWKKLHICVDERGMIVADCTTDHNVDDRSQLDNLLSAVKTSEILGDSGYDGGNIYKKFELQGIKVTIKPPNKAPPKSTKKSATNTRNRAIEYINNKGYQAWRVKNNYGRREIVENTMFRFKTIFGSKFMSRDDNARKTENRIKCQLLNRMFEIGKPISRLIA